MESVTDNLVSDLKKMSMDNCFPYDESLHTEKGVMSIGSLFEKWKKKDELPKILSFNQKKEVFEYKRITYAWRKERDDLIEIKLGNTLKKISIHCTPEHKVLTTQGYVQGKNLTQSHLVLCKYDMANVEEENIILPVYSPVTFYNQFIRYGTIRVQSVTPYTNMGPYVYDIEVEDNHNFVLGKNQGLIDGPIVSNCNHVISPVVIEKVKYGFFEPKRFELINRIPRIDYKKIKYNV